MSHFKTSTRHATTEDRRVQGTQGIKVCNQTKDGTVCDLDAATGPGSGAPSQEVCNGVDDDCNGQVDDGIVDDMVQVTWATQCSSSIDLRQAIRMRRRPWAGR